MTRAPALSGQSAESNGFVRWSCWWPVMLVRNGGGAAASVVLGMGFDGLATLHWTLALGFMSAVFSTFFKARSARRRRQDKAGR